MHVVTECEFNEMVLSYVENWKYYNLTDGSLRNVYS